MQCPKRLAKVFCICSLPHPDDRDDLERVPSGADLLEQKTAYQNTLLIH